MEKMYSSLVFLFLCLNGISPIDAFGFGVELIHRDSSKSPFYRSSETSFQQTSNAIRRSINRVNHFNQRNSFFIKNVESDVISTPGEYHMSYSIGTPPFKVLGILDTGSDFVWLQCKPCDPCYKQTTPIFDSSKSTTYKTIPCTSNICHSFRDASCSFLQQSCQYSIGYGDGAKSKGDIGMDTLTLGSTKGSPVKFPKIVIGCGHSNTGTFQGQGSGIVGLSNGPLSLITQLGSLIQGKFSHCLVPEFSSDNFTSKLNFGDDAIVYGHGTVSTPMILDTIFYYLILEGFSVGNKRVEFGDSPFFSSGNGKGNIIIDSGTTLTILPDDVYSKLESTVAAEVKLERIDDPDQFLSLCYKSSVGEKLKVPLITPHFRGADVQLNALNTFVQVSEDAVCFAFRSDPNVSIFGNLAQQNILVGYDIQKKIISLKPTDCTKKINLCEDNVLSISMKNKENLSNLSSCI